MNQADWDLLKRIVFDVAKTLQEGKHSTEEEWMDIADELDRASKLATAEANRLFDKEQ